MTTGSSRICSHQQVDDHCKKRRTTHIEHITNKQKGKLEPKVVLSCNQIYFHNQIYIHHPSMLWSSKQYTKTRLDSSEYVYVFNGCLHLWWISLLTPELGVTNVTMSQSLTHKVSP